ADGPAVVLEEASRPAVAVRQRRPRLPIPVEQAQPGHFLTGVELRPLSLGRAGAVEGLGGDQGQDEATQRLHGRPLGWIRDAKRNVGEVLATEFLLVQGLRRWKVTGS